MPRNVVSGEFTRVVQRVPVRIQIEHDDRWPRLRAGLSATVAIAHGPGDAGLGRGGGPSDGRARDAIQRARHPRGAGPRRGRQPTPSERQRHDRDRLAAPAARATTAPPAPPLMLEPRHWLAALAILFVFFAPYQTLVQTVITDDAVRMGIEADEYDMTWVTVGYGVGVLYGVFAGLWLSLRIGKRYTLVLAHARVLRRQRPLWGGDRARQPGPRPVRRGVRQDAGDGDRPRHALQAVRPRCCSWPSASTASSPTRRGTSPRCSRRTSTCTCPGGGCTGPTCRSG